MSAPIALSLGVLALAPSFAFAQAPTKQENTNTPAAVPPDRPQNLQLPQGPTVGPPPGNANTGQVTGSSPATSPDASASTAADQPTIIGNVTDSEGREISEVRVVGNRVVTEAAVLSQVRTQRGSAFSSRLVELDAARVRSLGFFALVQAQVTPDVNDAQKVVVTFIVTENRVVTGFRFVGNTLVKSEDLQKALVSKPGAILNQTTVRADVTALETAYKNRGFFALVPQGGLQQTDQGVLVFTVQEGRIGGIRFSGLRSTKESLVRRLVRSRVGQSFDAARLRRDASDIYDTGLFEDVVPDISGAPDDPASVVVTFLLKEKRTGNFNVGVGFDSRSKISGFVALGQNNLWGTGQRASVSVQGGAERNYQLSYGNPYLGSRLASYDVSVYETTLYRDPTIFRRIYPTLSQSSSIAEDRTGGRLSYVVPLDRDRTNSVSLGYRNERGQLKATIVDANGNVTNDPNFPLTTAGRVSAGSLGFIHDRRDSRLDPTKGERASLSIEQGGKFLSGTSNFTKFDLSLARYQPLVRPRSATEPSKVVLAGRVVLGRSLNQLPAFEQYFIGGPDTVRGYDSDFQFGDNQVFGNLELRYRFNKQIQGVLFGDAGSAFGGRFTSNSSADVLSSYGLGVRLQTPLGPIRLDYGIGRNGGRTHFAIGPTF